MNPVAPSLVTRRPVIDIMDAGLSFYRREYQKLAAMLLALFIPYYLLKFFFYQAGWIEFERIFNTFSFFETSSYTVSNIILLLLDDGVNWLTGGLVCRYVLDRVYHDEVSTRRVFKETLIKLLPLMWISFLSNLLILAGLGICFLPGVWLFLHLLFSTPLVVIEERLSFSAVWNRCAILMRQEWGRAMGFVLLSWLLLGILGLSLTYLFSGIYQIVLEQVAWLSGLLPDFDVLGLTAGAVISALLLPMQMIFIMLFYFDVRSRKEGYDLQVQIDQL